MSETADKERRKPGRKSETPAERLARLEKDLVAARRAVEQAEQLRLATIGAAVVAEADNNAAFMNELRRILRERVSTKAGLSAVASMIGGGDPGKPEKAKHEPGAVHTAKPAS